MENVDLNAIIKDAEGKIEIGKEYCHYRDLNKKYLVLHIALLEDSLRPCVVYRALYGDQLIWIRPVDVFLEKVEFEGKTMSRFRKAN